MRSSITLLLLMLIACEESEPDALAICYCYEDALKLDGEELRAEIISCAKKRDEIKAKYKEDGDSMYILKTDTQACMAPLEPILAQKSSETKKKAKSTTPNAQKIKKINTSRGQK
jgi:hypothetical protein